jgi:hypothetical protein
MKCRRNRANLGQANQYWRDTNNHRSSDEHDERLVHGCFFCDEPISSGRSFWHNAPKFNQRKNMKFQLRYLILSTVLLAGCDESVESKTAVKQAQPQPAPTEVARDNSLQTAAGEPSAWEKTKQSSGEMLEATKETTGHAWEATKEASGEAWEKTRQTSGEIWDKTKETSAEAWETTKETSGEAWQATKEKSGEVWVKTKETSAEAWDTTKQTSSELLEDAKQKLSSEQ